ncbi:hypothetical protein EJB05_44308, partial [Eragrostis curvula]
MPSLTILAAAALPHRRRRRRRRKQRSPESVTLPLSAFRSLPTRDWSRLPPGLISSIFQKLNPVEIMLCADKVCRSWRRAARDEPELWRRIDMRGHDALAERGLADLGDIAADAVVYSQGQCGAFWGEGRGVDDNILRFLADRAPLLKSLVLIWCREVSQKGFVEAVKRFPLLEELEVSKNSGVNTRKALKDVAMACPRLKHLRLVHSSYIVCSCCPRNLDDREAMAIATMHELRSLQLVYNDLTNQGLEAILDNCLHLESLDIQKCRNVVMNKTLQVKCARISRMKILVYDLRTEDDFDSESEERPIECSTCESYFRRHTKDESNQRHWSTSKVNEKEDMVITAVRELRSLDLYRKDLTTQGLRALLEKCPNLEAKDILRCCNIVVKNALGVVKYHRWLIPTRKLTTRLLATNECGSYKFNPEGLDIRNCRNIIMKNAPGDTFSPIILRKKAKNYHRNTKRLMAELIKKNLYSTEPDREELEPDGSNKGECSTCLMIECIWKIWDSDEHSDYYDPSYGLDSIDEFGFYVHDKILLKSLRRYLKM